MPRKDPLERSFNARPPEIAKPPQTKLNTTEFLQYCINASRHDMNTTPPKHPNLRRYRSFDDLRSPKTKQWGILNPSPDMECLFLPKLLDLFDRPILITFTVKLRSELELYSTGTRSSKLQHSNSDLSSNIHNTGRQKTLPTQEGESPPIVVPSSELLSCRRNIHDAVLDRLDFDTQEINTQPPPSNNISPLSPTFDPRKGLVPSGTVERRRSVSINPALDSPIDPPSAPSDRPIPITIPSHGQAVKLMIATRTRCFGHEPDIDTEERRILFDAAWKETERDLESYTERFDNERCRCKTMEKEELWEEIAGLLEERK